MNNNHEYQKIATLPPQAIDMEEAVLGAMLVDHRGLVEVMDILQEDFFYKPENKIIFSEIRTQYRESQAIDLLTIAEGLRKSKKLDSAGGESYLIDLSQKIASSAHIEVHSRIIIQKYIQRCLIDNSRAIIENCYSDNDVFTLLDNAYGYLNSVAEISVKPRETKLFDIVKSQILHGQKIYRGEIKPGINTPIQKLSSRTGGWRNSELIILAARPGMGKTAFALSCGLVAAQNNIPTAFFSLEMSAEQLTNRILSMNGKVDSQKFTVHGLSDRDVAQLAYAEKTISNLPFFIDDTASLSIEQFQIKAKRLKAKHGIRFIILDYLQLMSGKGKNREQEISKISRGLKLVAKDLDIPIIALSQLSRAVETRGGSKRPLLSDLRESGAIEQDADMVMFLYRPEYYKINEWEDDYNREPTEGEAEYIVAKNRNGGLVRNRMKFEARYTLFEDMPDQDNDTESNNQSSPEPPDLPKIDFNDLDLAF